TLWGSPIERPIARASNGSSRWTSSSGQAPAARAVSRDGASAQTLAITRREPTARVSAPAAHHASSALAGTAASTRLSISRPPPRGKIGRASCRERVELEVGAGAAKEKQGRRGGGKGTRHAPIGSTPGAAYTREDRQGRAMTAATTTPTASP